MPGADAPDRQVDLHRQLVGDHGPARPAVDHVDVAGLRDEPTLAAARSGWSPGGPVVSVPGNLRLAVWSPLSPSVPRSSGCRCDPRRQPRRHRSDRHRLHLTSRRRKPGGRPPWVVPQRAPVGIFRRAPTRGPRLFSSSGPPRVCAITVAGSRTQPPAPTHPLVCGDR